MKVLMLSIDRNVALPKSAVAQRMIRYGSITDELHIILLSTGGDRFPELQLSDRVWVHPTNTMTRPGALWKAIGMGKRIANKGWVVTAQDPFEVGFAAWCIARARGAKVELQVHTDVLSPYFARLSLWSRARVVLARFLFSRADGIRTVSQRIAHSLKIQSRHLKDTLTVLPILVNEASKQICKEEKQKQSIDFSPIVLMVSRLAPEKDIAMGVHAFKEILPDFPKAGLVIVGHGPERASLEALTVRLGIRYRIFFAGWQDDPGEFYCQADVFLSTSRFEGYGMALLEAALSERAIVTTDVGVVGEVLKDGESALVCPVGDVRCVVQNLKRVLRDAALRTQLGKNARETTRKHLIPSSEAYVKMLAAGWQRLVS